MLLKIEPTAPIIIDNFLKGKIKGLIKSVVETHIPSEWRQIVFITEGKWYDYKDYVRQMEELQKKVTPPKTPPIPQPVDNTNIYGLVKTGGYSKITIEFYNPTGKIQKLKLNPPYIFPRNKFQIRMPTTVTSVRG